MHAPDCPKVHPAARGMVDKPCLCPPGAPAPGVAEECRVHCFSHTEDSAGGYSGHSGGCCKCGKSRDDLLLPCNPPSAAPDDGAFERVMCDQVLGLSMDGRRHEQCPKCFQRGVEQGGAAYHKTGAGHCSRCNEWDTLRAEAERLRAALTEARDCLANLMLVIVKAEHAKPDALRAGVREALAVMRRHKGIGVRMDNALAGPKA